MNNFLSLLGLLFIALKLTHYIVWSWWVVLLPIYLPILLNLIGMACVIWSRRMRKRLMYDMKSQRYETITTDNRDYQK